MDPERWEKIKEIFYAAQGREDKAAYLLDVCGDDENLREEVESLLASSEKSDEFIETPAFETESFSLENLTGEKIGNYQILREIGRGGMGAVYLVERADGEFIQKAALKLVKRGFESETMRHRFQNERQILAELNHTNIAKLLDGGTTADGLSYFVMEYVEGLPLGDFCEQTDANLTERLRIFREICSAVSYAHTHLVIHRDLKPSNILVTNDGTPKLLDFGIAKLLDTETDAEQTATQMRVLTPEYASPEQIRGERISTASDVYSLGVILYELLTGVRPFQTKDKSYGEIVEIVSEIEPVRPSSVASSPLADSEKQRTTNYGQLTRSLKGDLDNIILKSLRKEPARRYNSVAEFSEDIRRYLAGLPVIAQTDSVRYHASKFVKRNKISVIAAVLIFLSIVGGLIATLWQNRIAKTERDRAQLAQKKAERINIFLQDALGAPNPLKEGREIKVIEVLEKAAARAEAELSDQPEVLAEVRQTIGVTYFNLELYEQAEPLLRAALETFREVLGEDHPKTAKCFTDFGDLLNYLEKYDEAIPNLQKAIEIYQKHPPEHARDLAQAKYSLAQTYLFKGEKQAAEPLYREVLDYAVKNLGENDPIIGDVSNEIANLIRDRDYENAIALYRQSERILRPIPEEKPDLATTLSNLGMVLTDAGRFDEAEIALKECLVIRREIFGNESPTLSVSMARLSRVHFYRGEYEEAVSLARQAVTIQEKNQPKGHRNFALSYLVLGKALTRNNKLAEAEKYLREGMIISREKLGPQDRNTAIAESALGECLMKQKRFPEAENLLKQGYETLKDKLGEKDIATVDALRQIDVLYKAWKKQL